MKRLIILLMALLASQIGMSQNGGTALSMASSSQEKYLQVLENPAYSLSNTDGITLEMWIKTGPDVSSTQWLMQKSAIGGFNAWIGNLGSDVTPDGRIFFSSVGGSTNDFIRTGQVLKPNSWYHLACVSDKSNDYLYVYLNGELIGDKQSSGFVYGTGDAELRIGGDPQFGGIIDDIRFWSTGLSQSLIRAWMHRDIHASHPEINSLSFYFNLNEGSGSVVNGSLGAITSGVLVGSPTWVNSQIPTAGSDPDFVDYEEVAAIWQTKLSNSIGGLGFSADNISASQSFLMGASPDFGLTTGGLQNCSSSQYAKRIDFSWQLLKQGTTINLNLLEVDLNSMLSPNRYRAAGMFFSDTKDDFSSNPNCPERLEPNGSVYSPTFAFNSTQLAVDYLSLGFTAPPISACQDPDGGFQLILNLDAVCVDANPGPLSSMPELGFHSGGTSDVNEIWGNQVSWDDPQAARTERKNSNTFVTYLPDPEAYYGGINLRRINFVFNQGPANAGNPWGAMAKTTDENGVCQDFSILLTEWNEVCTIPATGLSRPQLNLGFQVAPNPFGEQTQITFDHPRQVAFQVELLNAVGQRVRSYAAVSGTSLTIERGNLPAGMYLANCLHPNGQQLSTRLIIQ